MFRQSITIFQPQKLNISLLNRLNHYNIKVLLRDKPTYQDYRMIHDAFLHIHPDNLSIFTSTYPGLKSSSKLYLNDLEMVSGKDFEKLTFNGPLVLDTNNHLLANNENSMSRLLSNYDPLQQNLNLHNLVHPHMAEFADLF